MAFDGDIVPDAQRRIEAAQHAYASGRGTFDAIITARRSLLEAKLQRLSLAVEAVRAQVRIRYFTDTTNLGVESP
jgi:outer membrane protein TolC